MVARRGAAEDLACFASALGWRRCVLRLGAGEPPADFFNRGGFLPRHPAFAGFVIHSILGRSLRAENCQAHPSCRGHCSRPADCVYGMLMEPKPRTDGSPLARVARSPCPLAVDAPWERWSEETRDGGFVLHLLGCAGRYEAAVAGALSRASGGRIAFAGSSAGPAPDRNSLNDIRAGPAGATRIRLVLKTPLRLVRNKRELLRLDMSSVVRDLCFRIAVWGHQYQGLDWPAAWTFLEEDVSQVQAAGGEIRLVRFERYSGRQRRVIPMRGLLGWVVLDGVSPRLARVLKLGEICGIGKGATIGLGRIQVLPANAAPARGENNDD